jgi:hypothetical protein
MEKGRTALGNPSKPPNQAIQFPLPDAGGREKLVRLYSRGVEVEEEVIRAVGDRTDRVSAGESHDRNGMAGVGRNDTHAALPPGITA